MAGQKPGALGFAEKSMDVDSARSSNSNPQRQKQSIHTKTVNHLAIFLGLTFGSLGYHSDSSWCPDVATTGARELPIQGHPRRQRRRVEGVAASRGLSVSKWRKVGRSLIFLVVVALFQD